MVLVINPTSIDSHGGECTKLRLGPFQGTTLINEHHICLVAVCNDDCLVRVCLICCRRRKCMIIRKHHFKNLITYVQHTLWSLSCGAGCTLYHVAINTHSPAKLILYWYSINVLTKLTITNAVSLIATPE